MLVRRNRVVPDPEIDEDHVMFSVCHTTVGTKTRIFKSGEKMAAVYDWTGSLALEPENFELVDFTTNVLFPESPVVYCALNIREKSSQGSLLKMKFCMKKKGALFPYMMVD